MIQTKIISTQRLWIDPGEAKEGDEIADERNAYRLRPLDVQLNELLAEYTSARIISVMFLSEQPGSHPLVGSGGWPPDPGYRYYEVVYEVTQR